jgi:excisionase family DNA binding protein
MERLAVDVREAARLTSLSAFTIRRRVKSGELRAVRVGRRVLIPVDALQKLVRDGARNSAHTGE